MVGFAQKGPINTPTLVTSFPEFQRIFGGYLDIRYGDYRYLPHAVEGFFQNGGREVYVNRVAATSFGENELTFAGGNQRIRALLDERIVGLKTEKSNRRTGLDAFEDIDQIKLIAVPNGTSEKIQNAMIAHCERLKNRFAVLDPRRDATLEEIREQRSLYDSSYAALYYPWIRIRHSITGEILSIPPSGHICGIYARTDTQRGVHKAPANETIEGVLGPDLQINKTQQALLNPRGINCMREFTDRGFRVWGARTTSNDPLFRYINVRRLLLFLEESIKHGTRWVVFEPNNEKLWARVTQVVTQFLTNLWKVGSLMGETPEKAFLVKCDRTTMTQDEVNNGRINVVVGVAVVKPAEFVLFQISQFAGCSAAT